MPTIAFVVRFLYFSTVGTIVEILQLYDIDFLGSTYDPLDILMYGLGVSEIRINSDEGNIYRDKNYKGSAVDFSEIALQKLEHEKNELITTIHMDLSNSDNLSQLPISNSILINHFIPNNKVLISLQNKIKYGGFLMIVAFDKRMSEIRPIPHDYILDINSLEAKLSDMSLIKKEDFQDERGYFRAAVLRKVMV